MITINKSQISIMNTQYDHYPLERFLDGAIRIDVEHVELWGAAPHFHLEDMAYTGVCRVRKQIEERGLSLACCTPEQCIYPVSLATDSTVQRWRSLKYLEDNLRATTELDTDKMLVTIGWGCLDNSNVNGAWKYVREGLMSPGDMTRDYNTKLAPEMLRRDESNLIYNPPTPKGMMENLSHPAVGAMVDTIPVALTGKRSEDHLKVFGGQLVHVYFIGGAPRGHLTWGDGVPDMKGYLEEFSRYSYKGCLSLGITDGRYRVDPISFVLQGTERLYDVLN